MTPYRRSTAAGVAGMILVAIGAALPSGLLLDGLGVVAAAETRRLWLGATLFRLGLVALGLYLLAAGRLRIWGGEPGATDPKSATAPWSRRERAALAGLLIVALGLRLHRLGVGLWFDEIAAYVEYMKLSFGEILTTYPSESQHFLFTLLARAAFAIVGEGPAALRLPSALFGTASIGALYLFARKVATRQEAMISAALVTVSYHHIWFSQNARGYTILLFWTLLSSWLLLRALDEGRSGLWLGYAAAIALGVFTHVTMLFAVLAHAVAFVVWLVRNRASRRPGLWAGAVLGFGLAALLTFQLYALVVPQFLSTIGLEVQVPEWKSPLWTLLELVRGFAGGAAGSAVVLLALLVGAAGLTSLSRSAPGVVLFLFLPAVVGATALVAMRHPVWPRFFFFLMGFAVLIAVRGAVLAGSWAARVVRAPQALAGRAGWAVGVVLIAGTATRVPAAWLPKQDFPGARSFVEAQRQPGDAVVTVGLTVFPYATLYPTNWEAAETVGTLDAIRARSRRTWVVYTLPLHLKGEYPELMSAIQRDFTLVRRFGGTLGGGTIYLCRAEGPSVGAAARRASSS